MRPITYVELQTVINEVESILNNTPICADYDDDLDEILTPNHLVFGRRLETNNHYDSVVKEDQVNLCRRQQHLNGLLRSFWAFW